MVTVAGAAGRRQRERQRRDCLVHHGASPPLLSGRACRSRVPRAGHMAAGTIMHPSRPEPVGSHLRTDPGSGGGKGIRPAARGFNCSSRLSTNGIPRTEATVHTHPSVRESGNRLPSLPIECIRILDELDEDMMNYCGFSTAALWRRQRVGESAALGSRGRTARRSGIHARSGSAWNRSPTRESASAAIAGGIGAASAQGSSAQSFGAGDVG